MFCAELPTWCHDGLSALLAGRGHQKGMPLSWRHYQYGLAHLGRALMRSQLRQAEASRIAGAGPDKSGIDPYVDWHRKLTLMTGLGE